MRKEAFKLVAEGQTFADALKLVTKDADLKEAYFTTPVALRAAMGSASSESVPQKWMRPNFKGPGKGSFGKSSFSSHSKGKSKGGKKQRQRNPKGTSRFEFGMAHT